MTTTFQTADLDDSDEIVSAVPWTALISFALALEAFVLVGYFTGLCKLSWGARAYHGDGVLSSVFHFGLAWVVAHLFLVYPMTNWVYRQSGEQWGKARRLSVATMLLSIPTIAYGYYMGNVSSLLEFHELLVMVVPGVVIAALLYEKSGRGWIFSLSLVLNVLPAFVLVNDLLSPFVLWVAYASTGPGFYLLRTLLPAFVMAAALYWGWKRETPSSKGKGDTQENLEHFRHAAAWLFAYGLIVELFLSHLRFGWMGCLALFVCLARRTPLTYYCALFFCGIEIGMAGYQLLSLFPVERITFSYSAMAVQGLMALALYAAVFRGLLKQTYRRLFFA